MTTALLAAMIAAGATIAIQGYLIIKGRRAARIAFFERPLVEVLALKDTARVGLILGRLRVVYGFFLVVAGIWGLTGVR